MQIHVKTVIPPDDPLLDLLGREPCRWIYGELWLRLRKAIETGEGPLADAVRGEVDVMVAEATERASRAMTQGRPREELDRLIDEKYLLLELQGQMAPEVALPELVEDVPARPATGPCLKDGEEPL